MKRSFSNGRPFLLGLAPDAYAENKKNGVFLLIDPQTNNTVAVGIMRT